MVYFKTAKSFADVPITDEGVDTTAFLEAADGLMNMFDLLGSQVFGFVQTDLRNNITGVRERYTKKPDESRTLELLVRAENADGEKHATQCLGRLIRGLVFTCRSLQNMQADPSMALSQCFRRAYDDTLAHHHGFVVRKVVGVAILAVPYRPDFYNRVAQSTDEGVHKEFDEKLKGWLAALDGVCRHVKVFLEKEGFGRVTM